MAGGVKVILRALENGPTRAVRNFFKGVATDGQAEAVIISACMIVHKVDVFNIKLGGTAGVFALVPLGTRAFFVFFFKGGVYFA